ncbi:MAG TPA: chromate resistance protein ChrB domain-containing protein [Candidatus Saccharimonadales bacterium]|nr:chromate resistance protein ChrB domain-containing protein [Candidatus Saccharimonadales bacterium]
MKVRTRSKVAWLLLTFTLPTKQASQRVEIWRKLQRYGSIPLGNSGYLLPNNPANEERFQWLATAIRKYKGDASIVHVQSIDNISTPQLVARFAEVRAREYQELIRQLQEFSSLPTQKQAVGRLSRLRSRYQEIVEVDFFASPLQKRVAELLARADATRSATRAPVFAAIRPRDYKRRVWVTRPRPGVDRSASAWLIRRFIDANARFAFASEDQVSREAVPFDMFHERGFGHRGDDCTFETLQKQFKIRDKRVSAISEIIHDADLADGKFGRKEGYGIDEVLKGWARQGLSDQVLLERGTQLVEGLYHSLA